MALDVFMKIDGISGESSDTQHKDWIEVLSLNWTVDHPKQLSGVNVISTLGGPRSSEFGITKVVDKATPQIIKASISNENINEIKIELCRSGKEKIKYLEYVFKKCFIKAVVLQTANNSGESLPTENIRFRFASIEITYFQQTRDIGGSTGQISTQWNIAESEWA